MDAALIPLSLFCLLLHRSRGFIVHACSLSLYSEESQQKPIAVRPCKTIEIPPALQFQAVEVISEEAIVAEREETLRC